MSDRSPGQHSQRRGASFRDQHGRMWDTTIEIRSGHSCAPFTPRFKAPVLPPMQYIKHIAGSAHEVVIDYDQWEEDVTRARENYQALIRETALKLGVQGTVSQIIKNPPPEILDIVGPAPVVTDPMVIQALRAENPWAVYFEGEMPKAAAPFFPKLVAKEREQAEDWKPKAAQADPWGGPKPAGDEFVPAAEYVLKMSGPGWWPLPDGRNYRGTRADAMAELRRLFPEHYAEAVKQQEATV